MVSIFRRLCSMLPYDGWVNRACRRTGHPFGKQLDGATPERRLIKTSRDLLRRAWLCSPQIEIHLSDLTGGQRHGLGLFALDGGT